MNDLKFVFNATKVATTTLEFKFCAFFGFLGSVIASWFGGWSSGLSTLLIFMGIDYVTGLYISLKLQKSKKTAEGGFDSAVCWQGLVKKMMIMVYIIIAHRLDLIAGTTYFRDGTNIAFVISEGLSIIENGAIIGVPVPDVIKRGLELLKKTAEEKAGESE